MLARLRLLVFLHVHGARLAVDALDVVGVLGRRAAHLQQHELARQRDRSDVMPRRGLNGHDIAFLQVEVVAVVEVALAGVLELHLHQVRHVGIPRYVGQVVVDVQLAALLGAAAIAESAIAVEGGKGGSRPSPLPLSCRKGSYIFCWLI